MQIEDDVILDLLPVYLAGEASEATRDLVEAYVRAHPEFAALTTKVETQLAELQAGASGADQELAVLMRVKRILRVRSIIFGAALFCTAMPFSMVASSDKGVTWMMLQDAPVLAAAFGAAAVLLWGAYAWTHRALSDNGRS